MVGRYHINPETAIMKISDWPEPDRLDPCRGCPAQGIAAPGERAAVDEMATRALRSDPADVLPAGA